jgi:hypothetical protein
MQKSTTFHFWENESQFQSAFQNYAILQVISKLTVFHLKRNDNIHHVCLDLTMAIIINTVVVVLVVVLVVAVAVALVVVVAVTSFYAEYLQST